MIKTEFRFVNNQKEIVPNRPPDAERQQPRGWLHAWLLQQFNPEMSRAGESLVTADLTQISCAQKATPSN